LSSQVKGYVNDGFTQSTNKCDINPLSQIRPKSCQIEYLRSQSSVVSFDQNIDEDLSPREDNPTPLKTDKKVGRLRKISAPIFGSKLMTDSIHRRASEATVTVKQRQGFRRPSVLILPKPKDYKDLDDESPNQDIESPKTSRTASFSNFPFNAIEVSHYLLYILHIL